MENFTYLNAGVTANIDNGLYAPLIEVRNTMEINKVCCLNFELLDASHSGFKRTEFNIDLMYMPDTEVDVTFNIVQNDTTPIEMCYVRYPDENKIIFYAKPSFNGRCMRMKVNYSSKNGYFKILKFKDANIDLSSKTKVKPTLSVLNKEMVLNGTLSAKGTYECFIGNDTGTYLIGKIKCKDGYVSSTLNLLITTAEGNGNDFTNSIVSIRYRKTSNTSFDYRLSVIDGINTNDIDSNGISLGVKNIDTNYLGIYLRFTKSYSGVSITPLSFTTSKNSGFINCPVEKLAEDIVFSKVISLDASKIAQNKIITETITPLNDYSLVNVSEYFQKERQGRHVLINCYNMRTGTLTDGTIIGKITSDFPRKNICVPLSVTAGAKAGGTPRVLITTKGEISIRGLEENGIISFQIAYFI